MKKSVLIGLILSSAVTAVSANELSNQNLVERSLVLKDGEVAVSGAIFHGKTNKESDTGLALNAAFGVSDNLSIGFGGLRYSLLERANEGRGLELAVGAGIKGHMEQNNQDVLGYGTDVIGKYVLSSDLALVFGAEYVFWNKAGDKNASEYRYTLGAMYQPIERVTLSADYTYRDLKDFTQSSAYSASTGVHYAFSKNTDVGLVLSYSDFDAAKNGFDTDTAHKRNLGAYVTYRF